MLESDSIDPPRASGLNVCGDCGADQVCPTDQEEDGPDHWWVRLRCGNCQEVSEIVIHQVEADRLDDALDEACVAIQRDWMKLKHTNMAEWIESFAAAVHAGAILPEDF